MVTHRHIGPHMVTPPSLPVPFQAPRAPAPLPCPSPAPFRAMATPSRPSQTPSRAVVSLAGSCGHRGSCDYDETRACCSTHASLVGSHCARSDSACGLHVHHVCHDAGSACAWCDAAWALHDAMWGPGCLCVLAQGLHPMGGCTFGANYTLTTEKIFTKTSEPMSKRSSQPSWRH